MAPEPADNMWRSYRLSPEVLPEPNMVAEKLPGREALAALPLAGPKPDAGILVEREAESFDRRGGGNGRAWRVLEGLGGGGAMVLTYPFSDDSIPAGEIRGTSPWMEYEFEVPAPGKYLFTADLLPTYPLGSEGALDIGISLDDGEIELACVERETNSSAWKQEVLEGRVDLSKKIRVDSAGPHRLRIYLVDPGVVLDSWRLAGTGE